MDTQVQMSTELVSFGYKESADRTGKYDLHCHNFYELYLFLDGDVDYLVEGTQYRPTPGSLLLLSPHLFHGVKVNTDRVYRRFSLHFHPDILSMDRRALLLSVFCGPADRHRNLYFENVERFGIPSCFEALEDCARRSMGGGPFSPETEKEDSDVLLSICVEALLARILTMSSQTGPLPAKAAGKDTVSNVILYLNRHLREPVTLDQLSERFFISKHHLNKVFRQATGTTVMDYLLHKRVIAAQQLLIGGVSAQEAAARAGFGDYSSFYRNYTRIVGHSPLKDRGVIPSFSSPAAATGEAGKAEGIVFIQPAAAPQDQP